MKRFAFALLIVIVVSGLCVYGYEAWQDHKALAAGPTKDLPAGYLRPSASFLREFDGLTERQNELTKAIQAWQAKIPQGYEFQGPIRAFKPAGMQPPIPAPAPGPPPAPTTPPAKKP